MMTKDEFQKRFEDFWLWTSKRDRDESSWWLSVAEYANMHFSQAYTRERRERREAARSALKTNDKEP